ncbi:MAG TPA: hypothetical protein VGM06_25050 [Polyangiaceae bacterium]
MSQVSLVVMLPEELLLLEPPLLPLELLLELPLPLELLLPLDPDELEPDEDPLPPELLLEVPGSPVLGAMGLAQPAAYKNPTMREESE